MRYYFRVVWEWKLGLFWASFTYSISIAANFFSMDGGADDPRLQQPWHAAVISRAEPVVVVGHSSKKAKKT